MGAGRFIEGLEKTAVTLNKIVRAFSNAAVDRAVALDKVHVTGTQEKEALKSGLFADKIEDALMHANTPEEVVQIKHLYQSEFPRHSADRWANKRYLDNLRSSLPRRSKNYIAPQIVTKILKIQKRLRKY